MKCWASCLGNCGGGPSAGHYISDGIFYGEVVTAFGLSWCNDRPVNIGLGRAVAKILCKSHNEALSAFDREASKLSRFLSSNIVDDPLKSDAITLNGTRIEKWALKTCVNLGFLGALDQDTFARIEPSETLVRNIFTNEVPQDGMGLYLVTGAVSNDDYKVGLSWNAIRNLAAGGSIVGMTFTFNGIRFVVSVLPFRVENKIAQMGSVNGVNYSSAKIIYRPPVVALKSSTAGTKEVKFKW